MDITTYGRYTGVKKSQQDMGDELLTRLVHRMARSLGAFRSTAQALLNGADEDPMLRRELLQDMETELGELQRLLENVTQLKALERGTFRLNRRQLQPSPWLRQLVARWQRVAKEKGLSWVVNVPDDLPAIEADMDKLEQSLNNLLSNAVRHTPIGARILFSAGRLGDSLMVKIVSEKPRLDDEEYAHLFELFYTGDAQGRFPVGTGLGLHVTRELVEQHGGRIEVLPPSEGNDAVGFEVRLPTHSAPALRV